MSTQREVDEMLPSLDFEAEALYVPFVYGHARALTEGSTELMLDPEDLEVLEVRVRPAKGEELHRAGAELEVEEGFLECDPPAGFPVLKVVEK